MRRSLCAGARGSRSATEDRACMQAAREHAHTPHGVPQAQGRMGTRPHGAWGTAGRVARGRAPTRHGAPRARVLRHVGPVPRRETRDWCPPRGSADAASMARDPESAPTMSQHRPSARRVPGGDRTAVPVSAAAVGLTDVRTGGHTSTTPRPTPGLRGQCWHPPPSPLSPSHILHPPGLWALGLPSTRERASGRGGLSGLV